jgi:hypothetical protein
MVVLRNILRPQHMCSQDRDWRVSPQDYWQEESQLRRLLSCRTYKHLLRLFPFHYHISMPSNIALLEPDCTRQLRQLRDHDELHVWSFCGQRDNRLDLRHLTGVHCLRLEYESKDEDFGGGALVLC